jgi:phage-related tail protein
MQVDAQGTILKVMEAVNKLPKDQRLGVMVDLVGLEHSDTVAKLAGNLAEYRKQIALAGSQEAQGSMSKEFQARLQTTSAQWEILKNKVSETGVNIGSMLLPKVNELLDVVGSIATKTATWIKENELLVGNIATLVGALTGGYVAFQLFTGGLGAVQFALGALKLMMATHPILLVGTLMAAAAVLIYKNWEPIKEFFGNLWAGITESFRSAIDWIVAKVEWVGAKWQSFKASIGFGGSDVNVTPAPQAPATPDLPPLQPRGGGVVNNSQQNTINITQRPGQDSRAIAEEVARELERRAGVQRRSSVLDGAGAQ